MQHFVYILKSERDNGYYIGYTSDIRQRIEAHNQGLTKSTKGRRPFYLIWSREFKSKKDAMAYEHYLKSQEGYKEKISLIKNVDPNNPHY